jgi:hypothetical protein
MRGDSTSFGRNEPAKAEASTEAPGAAIDAAHLAQKEQLADHSRRLAELRASLSAQRERAAGADEQLNEARARPEGATPTHRTEPRAPEAAGQASEQSGRYEVPEAEFEEQRGGGPLAAARGEAAAAELEDTRLELKRTQELLERERATSSNGERRLAAAEKAAQEAHERIVLLERDSTEPDERNAALGADLGKMRQALRAAQADHAKEREERLEEIERAEQRISELEGENSEIDKRRESLEAILAEARSSLEQERIERAELAARLEAAEEALGESRAARYRAEQQLAELNAGLRAAGFGELHQPAQLPPPRTPETIPSELTPNGAAPWLSSEALAALDFDGLAEVYDIAAEAWRAHSRIGRHEVAESWRTVARKVVDEAARREDAVAADGPRGRRLPRRQERIRDQLREACAERLTDAGG